MQSQTYYSGFPPPSQLPTLAEANTSTITLTSLNQFLSPLLRLPATIRTRIFTFALCNHRIRVYVLASRIKPRVCPECYFGAPYAMAIGPAVPLSVLLALGQVSRQLYLETQGLVYVQNEFVGYPAPLLGLFTRMHAAQADLVTKITVSVLVPFETVGDGRTIVGLAGDVSQILRILCGMRGLRDVCVDWNGKHDNYGEAHEYFKMRVSRVFDEYGRKDVRVLVPTLG